MTECLHVAMRVFATWRCMCVYVRSHVCVHVRACVRMCAHVCACARMSARVCARE